MVMVILVGCIMLGVMGSLYHQIVLLIYMDHNKIIVINKIKITIILSSHKDMVEQQALVLEIILLLMLFQIIILLCNKHRITITNNLIGLL